ncbi:MAG: hypothetical protein ACXVAM_00515 [Vulcanimicrobiaceae bacterium]
MTRLTRFAMVTALGVALCLGTRVEAAPQSVAHLSYARVFDRTDSSFLRTDVAMESTASIISASAFGMDVQLPIFVRTSEPAYDANDAVHLAQNSRRLTLSSPDAAPWVTGVIFRLNGVRVQMQYQTVSSSSTASGAAQQLQQRDPTIVSFDNTIAPAGPLSNAFAANSTATGAPTFSYATQSPFADPGGLGFAPYSAPQTVARQLTVPMRVGPLHFSSNVQGSSFPNQSTSSSSFDVMQQCGTADPNAACAALRQQDNRFAAGTSFNVRAGARRLNVNVSGSVERQSLPEDTGLPYLPLDPQAPSASTQAAALSGQSAVSYPNAVDVTKHGINANVAVPVTRHVTVNLGYDTQHFQGDYNAAAQTGTASTLVPGIDARKDTYLGNITYQLPHTNSAITFSARQYRYQDNFEPNLNLTQTRADVNFTVKF